MEHHLEKEIEAILFYKSEPVSIKELMRLLDMKENNIREAIMLLQKNLEKRGIVLIDNNNEYSLATSPEVSNVMEKVAQDELSRDISVASLEVLSIIAYKGSTTRREIEYIRGVNSSYSLRALLVRGLIEKETSRLDERVFMYKPTLDLLRHLGIASLSELPEWKSVQTELEQSKENVIIEEIKTDEEKND